MATQASSISLHMFLELEWYDKPFRELDDPEKSIRVDMVKGEAAGKLDAMYSLFPPEGVGRPLAYFTFCAPSANFSKIPIAIRRFENGSDPGADSLALGTIDSDFLKERGIQFPHGHHLDVAGVRYNLRRREGYMFFRKEMWEKLIRAW